MNHGAVEIQYIKSSIVNNNLYNKYSDSDNENINVHQSASLSATELDVCPKRYIDRSKFFSKERVYPISTFRHTQHLHYMENPRFFS